MEKTIEQKHAYRVGKWLPEDQLFLENWLARIITEATEKPKGLDSVIEEFKQLIENDPEVYMLFHMMFNQVPHKEPYNNTPTGKPQIRDYKHFLLVLNHILTTAPEFNTTGLVGFPINAILDWPMGTIGGFAAFINDRINKQFKKVLNRWGEFLMSKESRYVLNKDNWLSPEAKEAWHQDWFEWEPKAPYGGFDSWDDFFIREFKEGLRPVAEPDNQNVIANACESAPYKIAQNVKLEDNFWIKGQPYSLRHIMGDHKSAETFAGGTIYQAFLSALSYHRWHSPVDGVIEEIVPIDGTYYSEILSEGFLNPSGPDPAAPNDSQGYLSEVAARTLIFIKADNPAIGLMCFVSIGMSEVSTSEVTVEIGQHVKKGEQLGMFHFGGSTHCLIFRPEVNLRFDMHGEDPGLNSSNIPINSRIAVVK